MKARLLRNKINSLRWSMMMVRCYSTCSSSHLDREKIQKRKYG